MQNLKQYLEKDKILKYIVAKPRSKGELSIVQDIGSKTWIIVMMERLNISKYTWCFR